MNKKLNSLLSFITVLLFSENGCYNKENNTLEWKKLNKDTEISCNVEENEITAADLENITILNLNNKNIWSLKELRALDLSENIISDITPLASLEDLSFLYINNNCITDLTPLDNLDLDYLLCNYQAI